MEQTNVHFCPCKSKYNLSLYFANINLSPSPMYLHLKFVMRFSEKEYRKLLSGGTSLEFPTGEGVTEG